MYIGDFEGSSCEHIPFSLDTPECEFFGYGMCTVSEENFLCRLMPLRGTVSFKGDKTPSSCL